MSRHTIHAFNESNIIEPVFLKRVRFISDAYYFNNIQGSNICSVIPTVGVGINTLAPRTQLDVVGSIITTSNVGIGNSNPLNLLSVSGGCTIGAAYSNLIAPSNGMAVSGNVGIGTVIARSKLVVAGGASVGYTNATAPQNSLIIANSLGVGTSNPGATASISGGMGVGAPYANLAAPPDGAIIAGNVGIGTAAAANSKLVVNGGVAIGNPYTNLTAPSDGAIIAGNVGIGTNIPGSRLAVGGNLAVGSSYTSAPVPLDGAIIAGNVGIGTDTPGAKLSVYGGIGVGAAFSSCNVPANGMAVAGNVGIGTVSAASILSVYGGVAVGSTYVSVSAPTNSLIVEGNIGIGVINPVAKLSVAGAASIGEAYQFSTPPGNGLIVQGNVGIGTVSSTGSKLAVAGSTAIGSSYTQFTIPTNSLAVEGNVGIGVINPTNAKLSVAGGVMIGSSFAFSNAPSDGVCIQGNIGVGTLAPASSITVAGGGGVIIGSNATAPAQSLIVTGKIGVGTLTPGSTVSVAGSMCIGSNITSNGGNSNGLLVQGLIETQSNILIHGDGYCQGTFFTSNLNVLGNIATLNSYTVESSNFVIDNQRGSGPALLVKQLGQGANFPVADFYDIDVSTTVPRFRVADGGNIGINTTAPGAELDVWGNIGVSNIVVIDNHINVVGSNITALSAFYGKVATQLQDGITIMPSIVSLGSNDATTLRGTLLTSNQQNLRFFGLYPESNIGIGTLVPLSSAKIDVYGNIAVGGTTVIDSNTNVIASNVTCENVYGNVATPNQPLITTLSNVVYVGAGAGTQLIGTVATPTQTGIRNLIGGRIGIATETPRDDLDVWGNVATAGVQVIDANQNAYFQDVTINGSLYGNIAATSLPGVQDLPGVMNIGSNNSTAITGTLYTANQPYIRYIGINGGACGVGTSNPSPFAKLDVTGNIAINGYTVIDVACNINGMVTFANQPYIKTLSNVGYVGSNSSTTVVGTLATSNQPNIRYVQSLGINQQVITPDAKLDVAGNIAINNIVVADVNSNLYGSIWNPIQPYITTLPSVTSVGANSSTLLTGTIMTPVQSNILYLGLTGNVGINTTGGCQNALDVWGNIGIKGIEVISSNYDITCSNINILNTIAVNSFTVSNLYANITQPLQPQITKVGSLTGLTVLQPGLVVGDIIDPVNGSTELTVVGDAIVGTSTRPTSLLKVYGNANVTGNVVIGSDLVVYGNSLSNLLSTTSSVSGSTSGNTAVFNVTQNGTGDVALFGYATSNILRVYSAGITTSNISACNITASSFTTNGTISCSNLIVNGSSGFFLSCNVTSIISNSTTTVPTSSLLYSVASNIVDGKYITEVNVGAVAETATGVGLYNITATALGNSSVYSWTLSNITTGVSCNVSGSSPYTFSNYTLVSGTTSCNVTFNVTASTGGSGPSTTSTSSNTTVLANPPETIGQPYIIVNGISFPGASSTAVDGINYYSGTLNCSFGTNTLGFSNLNNIYPYSGTNFLTIGSSNFSWTDTFTQSPSNAASLSNTKTISVNTTSSNLSFTVRNVLGSSTIVRSIAYLPLTPTSIVFPCTNALASNVVRYYENTVNLGTNDMLYAPLKNAFVSSSTQAISGFDYAITPSAISGKTKVFFRIIPYPGAVLSSFGVQHNSPDVTDIAVMWPSISLAVMSASTSYTSSGCGYSSNASTWYIRRPVSMSQTDVSDVIVGITYSGANIQPIPSIV